MFGKTSLITLAFVCVAFVSAKQPEEEKEVSELPALEAACKAHPEMSLCSLADTMNEVMVEMDHLLAGNTDDGTMEKRKSAFVRFGKRKSAFVRFGKRKSSYVRFGRK